MRFGLALLLIACGGTDRTSDCSNIVAEQVPSEKTALFNYLDCGGYEAFAKESSIHPSVSAHSSNARVFINGMLLQSLTAGAATHPVGAAAVKEIYSSDATTLRGYAAMVKLQDGNDGNAWYWYETYDADGGGSALEGVGNRTCTGCHSENDKDYFLTAFPLQ